jgi:hypothetical protein
MKRNFIIKFVLYLCIIILVNNTEISDLEKEDFVFEFCDHGTPDTIDDCTKHQTEDSSCCYFEYGNKLGCVMLGKRYLGDIEYGALIIKCNSLYVKANLLISLMCLLLYMF